MTDELVLAQVRDFHRTWGETDTEELDPLDLWERLGDILALQPTDPAEALASQTPQGASAGTRYCEDCDGFGVFGAVRCISCNGSGRA